MTNHQNVPPQNMQGTKVFGIISFVVACISLLFSFIPCIGFYALTPAALALIFSIIVFIQMKKAQQQAGLYLGGIIIATLAVASATMQRVAYSEQYDLKNQVEGIIDEEISNIQGQAIDDFKKIIENEIEKELANEKVKELLEKMDEEIQNEIANGNTDQILKKIAEELRKDYNDAAVEKLMRKVEQDINKTVEKNKPENPQ